MKIRYDNNLHQLGIDVGGVGCWGEGHSNDILKPQFRWQF